MERIAIPIYDEAVDPDEVADIISQFKQDLRRIKRLLIKSAEQAEKGQWKKAGDLLSQARKIARNK